MKQKLLAVLLTLAFGSAAAQNLPAGSIGTVTGNTPNTWQNYSYSYTPSTTGANYVGFAFRQDPAFWTFDNVTLTTGGGSNLLTNGNFASGGPISTTVTVNGHQQNITIQAPNGWGVWYQNGTYPAAAGAWQSPGVWYDGAVGTFDGIYQGVTLTAGTSYLIGFDVSGNHTSNGGSVQLGIYAGPCNNTSIAPNLCTIPSSAGFTTLATPQQGESAGAPVRTLQSSVATDPLVARIDGLFRLDVANAVPFSVTALTRGEVGTRTLPITRTITPYVYIPTYYQATSTPQFIQTWSSSPTSVTIQDSDNATTVDNGRVTVDTISQNGAADQKQFLTRVDQMSTLASLNNKINQSLLSDTLNRVVIKDGRITSRNVEDNNFNTYIQSVRQSSNTVDTYKSNVDTTVIGGDYRIDADTLIGAQFAKVSTGLNGQDAGGSLSKDSFSLYGMFVKNNWIFKGDLGIANNIYNSFHTLPELGMANSATTKGQDTWAHVRVYTPEYKGFRPFAGFRKEVNKRDAVSESGSALTAVDYATMTNRTETTELGLRYEYNINDKWVLTNDTSVNSKNLIENHVALMYNGPKNSVILLKITQQQQSTSVSNSAQVQVNLNF